MLDIGKKVWELKQTSESKVLETQIKKKRFGQYGKLQQDKDHRTNPPDGDSHRSHSACAPEAHAGEES